MKNSTKYLQNLLIDQDKIVVACSGGPDSMFLMHLLIKLRQQKNITLICAHVNHNLRQQSEEEYQYVKQFCLDNNIILEYLKIEEYEQDNFHNTARKKRYDFFEEVIKKYQAQYLMTAHHGDDLIETILMRLSRGASLNGYAGFSISTKLKDYMLIRPLIFMTKEEIKNYMDNNNLKYYIDESNNSDKYTRNRYRHHLLPYLKEENKDIHLKYLSFSEEINKCNEFIEELVQSKIKKIYQKNLIDIPKFKEEHSYIQERLINYILKDIYDQDLNLITKKHHNLILEMINSTKPNITINIPLNILLVKEYNKIRIIKDNKIKNSYEYVFSGKIKHQNFIVEKIDNSQKTDNYHLYLNSKELTLPLVVRSRKQGDRIEIKNLNGHKKVKDVLIDSKVPISKREHYPLVTDSNNNILWIPGLKKSKFDRANTKNYDIILRYQEIEGDNYE